MGRISTGVGLVSGLATEDIIAKLISLESRPIQLIEQRLAASTERKTALNALTVELLALTSSTSSLANPFTLKARSVTSANENLIRATVGSGAAPGTYFFRPVQQAQTQTFLSKGFADQDATPLGAGVITIKRGGFVQGETRLDSLNGGEGVRLGKIRITDRGGASAVVDLTTAQTVDDVLRAVNQNDALNVVASTKGDAIVLTDQTGLSISNLTVADLTGGATAADLGLVGSVAAATLTGGDVVRLGEDLLLSTLNDGSGVRRSPALDDLRISLRNQTQIDVNLDDAKTIGDVLDAINNHPANAGQVSASLSADGDRILLTDFTAGGGFLTVSALNGSRAADDLGILGSEQGGGLLSGDRVLASLNSVLLKNLNGGAGLSSAGSIQITNRLGAVANVDLSNADSLSEVIDGINAAGLGITASVNRAGNGIQIVDATGGAVSDLIIADLAAGTTAADLNIAVSTTATTINSGDLNLQYINEGTLLSTLNGGRGVARGKISVTDSTGAVAEVDLTSEGIRTVDDVLLAFAAASVGVTATINDTGDGILLTDTAGGGGSLIVQDVSGGTTAADLRLLGNATGEIDGAFRYQITLDADDALQEFVAKASDSKAPLSASIINTGSGSQPFRLFLASQETGRAGRLLIDTGDVDLGLSVSTRGVDAALQLTSPDGGAPLLVNSSTNTFNDFLPGLSLDVLGTSNEVVGITVKQDDQPLIDAVKKFVDNFNKLTTSISQKTSFNSETFAKGVLQGDRTARDIEAALFSLTAESFGASTGSIRRLSDLGVSLKGGVLTLNESVLNARIAANDAEVKEFLSAKDIGVAERVKKLLERFTNAFDGAIARRVTTIDDQSSDFERRVTLLNARLESKRIRLSNQFLAMERTLAELQSQQQALFNFSPIAPLSTARQSRQQQ